MRHLKRIRRRCDGSVAGASEHSLEQQNIGILVVDDQDAGVEDPGPAGHMMCLSDLAH